MRRFVAAQTAVALIAVAAGTARAQTAAAGGSIWTFQVENDAVSTLSGTSDQYYTSGLRLGWTSGSDATDFGAGIGHAVWGDGSTRVSLELSQSLFTPRGTQLDPPDPNDRPYAGVLLLTGGLIHESASTQDVAALSLGIVGPAALGEEVQNGFHDIIGDTPNRGWHYQIQNQPAFNLLFQRTWRLPMADMGGVQIDLLPSAAAAVGDVRDNVQLGGIARIGQGLASDFGPARIEPGQNGTDAFTPTSPLVWYAFAGADGQAVGYDVTLDGSTFRSHSPSVPRIWDVGEFEAGLAVIVYGARVSYTQTWQTAEFKGAKAGLFNFGSLALSVGF